MASEKNINHTLSPTQKQTNISLNSEIHFFFFFNDRYLATKLHAAIWNYLYQKRYNTKVQTWKNLRVCF